MPKAPKICATCGSEYEHGSLFCPKDGTPLGNSRTKPGEDPYIGLLLSDQIELRQLIGIGSMGRVYRAFQRGVERDVAVKMLHRELSANSTLVTRFLREARISSRLTHPNVVQVLMAGQLPSFGSDSPVGGELHIVMEHLDGISLLSALAASNGAMPLPRALHVILQICDAVGEAHAQGIVHRDLKPENVMLVKRGDDPDFVKVLDFGIARLDWGDSSIATQAGLIFGTARYISPEGSQGEPAGPTADVYAIATVLYQCIAGRTPFDNDTPLSLLMQHAHEEPPPIKAITRASYLPAPLAAAIMRNLAKKAEKRAPDARQFGRELVEAARASGLSPDDLVPRSTLLGQRAARGASFVSLQATKQLELSPEVAAIIGAHGSTPQAAAPETGVEATVSDSEIPGPLPGSIPTAPVRELMPSAPARESMPSAPARESRPSAPARESRPSAPMRESMPSAPPARGSMPSAPARESMPSAPPARGSMPSAPARESMPSAPVRPSNGTARTLDDDDTASSRRGKARVAVFVLACFLGGAGVVAFGAHHLGYFETSMEGTSKDSYRERADHALRKRQWDQPPGDNVKEITDEGLAKFPRDPSLLEVRRRTAEELVSSALGKKYGGDLRGALRHAALARELTPENTTAQHLVVELEGMLEGASVEPDVIPIPAVSVDAGKTIRKTGRRPVRPPAPATSSAAPPKTAAPKPRPTSPPPSTSGRWL